MPDISVERLRERLEIDDSGVLRWRYCASMPKQWNSVWPGKEAFTAVDGKGYRHGSLDGKYVRLHRVVWALAYGAWPDREVDHIDGNRLNNRVDNLRLVSGSENHRNTKRRADNKSGVNGVGWYAPTAKWRAHVTLNGKHIHLGYFETFEEAVAARAEANSGFGFHPNHGTR